MYTQFNNLPYTEKKFVSSIMNLNDGKSERVSVALAKVIADKLLLPNEKVDDIDYYFSLTHLDQTTTILNHINELFSIDYSWISKLVTNFYKQRYHTVFPPETYFISNKENAFIDFMNINKTIDDNIKIIISANFSDLNILLNGFSKLVNIINNTPSGIVSFENGL